MVVIVIFVTAPLATVALAAAEIPSPSKYTLVKMVKLLPDPPPFAVVDEESVILLFGVSRLAMYEPVEIPVPVTDILAATFVVLANTNIVQLDPKGDTVTMLW